LPPPSTSSIGAKDGTAQPVADGWAQGLRPRIVYGLVMAVIALVAITASAPVFHLFIAVCAVILAWEWTRLCGGGRFGWTGFWQAAAVACVVAAAAFGSPAFGLAIIIAGIVVDYIAARISGRTHPRWIAAGMLYIGLPCIALVWLRSDGSTGQAVILWLFVAVWATDIGAYFAGRLIGGPRLAPRISPGKTWAGLIGAAVAAALAGVILSTLDNRAPAATVLAIAGIVLAVVAQLGDLGESWVKRRFGVKDSSQLIPGHGGLFDRVDGLLAAALALALWQWTTGGSMLVWQ
jgi:phosphatidate cytidylyltransferase